MVLKMNPAAKKDIRVAIIDNSVNPSVYKPLEHWAGFLGVPFSSFRAPEGRLPGLKEDFTHFILTGSEASILDREGWVDDEVEFVQEALSLDFSVLGSCYGHQLLALAMRGPAHVRRACQPEIGWYPIDRCRNSGLLGKKGAFYAFSSHFDEVVNLDEKFRILASTSRCPIQAFEVRGRPVWGLQFHPEIDILSALEYLRSLVDLGLKTSPLFAEALLMEPQDSGLISRIVRHFLGSRRGR